MAVKKAVAKKTAGAAKKEKKVVAVAEPTVAAVVKKPRAAAKKVVAAESTNADIAYVVIDHPAAGETLLPHHYAIRIGASWGGIVEFQINDSEWMPCRHNAGYWWYDWHTIPSGKYKLAARIVDNTGSVIKKSAIKRIEVL